MSWGLSEALRRTINKFGPFSPESSRAGEENVSLEISSINAIESDDDDVQVPVQELTEESIGNHHDLNGTAEADSSPIIFADEDLKNSDEEILRLAYEAEMNARSHDSFAASADDSLTTNNQDVPSSPQIRKPKKEYPYQERPKQVAPVIDLICSSDDDSDGEKIPKEQPKKIARRTTKSDLEILHDIQNPRPSTSATLIKEMNRLKKLSEIESRKLALISKNSQQKRLSNIGARTTRSKQSQVVIPKTEEEEVSSSKKEVGKKKKKAKAAPPSPSPKVEEVVIEKRTLRKKRTSPIPPAEEKQPKTKRRRRETPQPEVNTFDSQNDNLSAPEEEVVRQVTAPEFNELPSVEDMNNCSANSLPVKTEPESDLLNHSNAEAELNDGWGLLNPEFIQVNVIPDAKFVKEEPLCPELDSKADTFIPEVIKVKVEDDGSPLKSSINITEKDPLTVEKDPLHLEDPVKLEQDLSTEPVKPAEEEKPLKRRKGRPANRSTRVLVKRLIRERSTLNTETEDNPSPPPEVEKPTGKRKFVSPVLDTQMTSRMNPTCVVIIESSELIAPNINVNSGEEEQGAACVPVKRNRKGKRIASDSDFVKANGKRKPLSPALAKANAEGNLMMGTKNESRVLRSNLKTQEPIDQNPVPTKMLKAKVEISISKQCAILAEIKKKGKAVVMLERYNPDDPEPEVGRNENHCTETTSPAMDVRKSKRAKKPSKMLAEYDISDRKN